MYYSALILIGLIPIFFISHIFFITILLLFLGVILLKATASTVKAKNNNVAKPYYFIQRIIYQVLHDLSLIYGILFYFPKSIKEQYEKIK
jgi:hypothetical protein